MGHQLTREIKAGAPVAWTPRMRLVADAIADAANDRTRRAIGYRVQGYERSGGRGWRDGICEHTGLPVREVQRALAALAAAGFELRVAIGQDSAGRPLYACRGHGCDYTVPPLPARERASRETPFPAERASRETPKPGGKGVTGDAPYPQQPDPLISTYPQRARGAPLRAAPAIDTPHRQNRPREEGPPMPAPRQRNRRQPSPNQSPLWPAAVKPGAALAPLMSTRDNGNGGTVALRGGPGFDDFWQAFPRRVAKGAARKAWEQMVVKGGADPAAVVAGAARYATERAGGDPQFTKHPATWLRAECWADEPLRPVPADPVAALRATLPPGDANVLDHMAAAAELDRRWAAR